MPFRPALRARRVRPRYVHGKSAAQQDRPTSATTQRQCSPISITSMSRRRDGRVYIGPSGHDGWFWIIPLPEGTSSVGFVGTQKAFKARVGNPGTFCSSASDKVRRSVPGCARPNWHRR